MRDVAWKSMRTAPKDGSSFLVFIPRQASNLRTQGFYTMSWSGWGGGVWETGNGWRPFEEEVENAVWTDLKVLAMSAGQASERPSAPA